MIPRLTVLIFLCAATFLRQANAHVPHDIIYSLGVSPDYAADGLIFSSSTQFGESHLVSHNRGETFAESNTGMLRALVTSHTFSPHFKTDGTVYLATETGYYKSIDHGENWVKQPLFDEEAVLSIALSADAAQIYILTQNGVHLVSNDGDTQETLQEHKPIQLGKLKILHDTLYVHRVTYYDVVTKNGMDHIHYASGTVETMNLKTQAWPKLGGAFEKTVIADFDVNATAIVVTTTDGHVHLSADNGATWKDCYLHEADFVCKIAFSPDYANDHTLAAAMAKGYVYLSTDGGAEWTLKSNGLSRWVHHINIHVNELQFSPNYANDQTIFLGKTTGFYKTTDNGSFWRHINVWNPKWGYFVYPAPNKDSKDVFTATYNSGISRSHDGGDTWQSGNVGITSAFANSMALSPNYAEDQTIFVVDIATGLYRSKDGGRTWAAETDLDISKGYDQPVLFRKFGISPNYKDNGLMFLFTVPRKTLGLKEKHVWKYNDHSKELKQVQIGGGANYINDFGFAPKGSAKKTMFAAAAQGLFVSEDEGDTWTQRLKGSFDKVIVSPNFDADGLIYLMDGQGRVHASTDAGQSFKPIRFALQGQPVENLTFSPNFSSDQTLYAATYGEGVFKSTDLGKTWVPFALRGKLLYTGLAFSANFNADQTMFAPAVDGIYRSTDGGKNWKNVLNQTQFLPKVPFLTFKDPEGHELPLSLDLPEIERYDGYDPKASPEVLRPARRWMQKIDSPHAYLGSYYKFTVAAGYTVEVYFYGTGIDYKTVTGPDLGIVDLFLDDQPVGQFDLYSAKETFDVSGFRKSDLPLGFHTLRILATGSKNPAATGTGMTFNAANIGN